MKKLTEPLKWLFGGIIAAIIGIITFIFGEKRSINKHQKATNYKPKSKQKHSISPTLDLSKEETLIHYLTAFASELNLIPNKRSLKKLLESAETVSVPLNGESFEECLTKVAGFIKILEIDNSRRMLACHYVSNSVAGLVLVNYIPEALNITAMPNTRKKKDAQAMIESFRTNFYPPKKKTGIFKWHKQARETN